MSLQIACSYATMVNKKFTFFMNFTMQLLMHCMQLYPRKTRFKVMKSISNKSSPLFMNFTINFLCSACSYSRENLTLKSWKAWPWRQAQHFTVCTPYETRCRGPNQKLSETDRARALCCLDAGMGCREVARRFRTSHQTINRIRQRNRQTDQRIGTAQDDQRSQQGLKIARSPILSPEIVSWLPQKR